MRWATDTKVSRLGMFLWGTVAVLGLAACTQKIPAPASPPPAEITILAMNDIYRIAGIRGGSQGGLARVAALRQQLESEGRNVLVLHAGDALSPALLGNSYKGAQMVDVLNWLDHSDAPDDKLLVTFGNHEFDYKSCQGAKTLEDRMAESKFTWLAGNLDFSRCSEALGRTPVIKPYKMFDLGGIKLAVIGITLDKPEYSALLTDRDAGYSDELPASMRQKLNFDSYVAAAKRLTAAARAEGAEYVVALTHIDRTDDVALLDALGAKGPDLVIGGHDHVKMALKAKNGREVYKQTAEALDVGIHEIRRTETGFQHRHHNIELGADKTKDPVVDTLVRKWLSDHEKSFCANNDLPAGCLSDPMGVTKTEWTLDEDKNRESETAIGDWLADAMLSAGAANLAFCPAGRATTVGVLGAGSLRLNYSLPANFSLTRRDIEEIFPYAMNLAAICTNGKQLKDALEHALSTPGAGSWLHTTGMRIRYLPASLENPSASVQTLTTLDGTDISDDAPVMVVANSYVAARGDNFVWDVCPSIAVSDRRACETSILTGKDANAKPLLAEDGSVADLKAWVLTSFRGQTDGVGPSANYPIGRLQKE